MAAANRVALSLAKHLDVVLRHAYPREAPGMAHEVADIVELRRAQQRRARDMREVVHRDLGGRPHLGDADDADPRRAHARPKEARGSPSKHRPRRVCDPSFGYPVIPWRIERTRCPGETKRAK
jgi:hypothetical protein